MSRPHLWIRAEARPTEQRVPIVPAGPDYGRKVAIFGAPIVPTGDPEADLAPAFAFFRTLVPRHPDQVLFPDGRGMDGSSTPP